MKNSIIKSFLLFCFVGLSLSNVQAQCANFPKPVITNLGDPNDVNKAIITITNLPAGASSSINNTFTVGKTVYPNLLASGPFLYNVRMRLNGCESHTEVFRFNRFGYPHHDPGCYRIVNKATGKVLEIEGNSLAQGARVRQATFTGAVNQLWQQAYNNFLNYGFISRSSYLALDANCTNGKVTQSEYDKGTNLQWSFDGFGGEGTFRNCGKALKAERGDNEVSMETIPLTGTITDNFIWKVEKVPCPSSVCSEPALVGLDTVCYGSTSNQKIINASSKATVKLASLGGSGVPPNFNVSVSLNGVLNNLAVGGSLLSATVYDKACITRVAKNFVVNLSCPPSATGVVLAATNQIFAFEARASEGRTKLQWITNTGDKTNYFEVERLNPQGNFEVLVRQNTEGGTDLKSYSFTDNDPLEGDNFYRIHSISNAKDTPQYSELKKVSFAKNDGISIFPNPADASINVDLRKYEGQTVTLSFYNALGLLVKKQMIEKVSTAPQQVDVQGFGTGSYLMRVQSEGKREVTRLFNITK